MNRINLHSLTLFLIIGMKVFCGHTLNCHSFEYEVDNDCCPKCPPGSRVTSHCSETRSTSCSPCLEGTFLDVPSGLKECFPCRRCDPGSGLTSKMPCRADADTVCEPLPGFLCRDFTHGSCANTEKHGSCQPGQFISEPGNASSHPVCSSCPEGTYSDGSSTSCRPHTKCEGANPYLEKPGSASSDVECSDRSRHRYGLFGVLGLGLLLMIGVRMSPWLENMKPLSETDHRDSLKEVCGILKVLEV